MMDALRELPDTGALLDAVRLNWRLWTIFQASLSSPETQVPDDVRANMLSLSNFVDRHTVSVLAAPAADKIDVLVKINRELAAGLMTPPPAAQAAASSERAAVNTTT